jgi:DNA excision repair protein ERCC-4
MWPHMQNGALLLLGAQPWQRDAILSELRRQAPAAPAPADINNEVPATERINLYRSNAAAFVTARILVVDFLSARLLPRHVAGGWVVCTSFNSVSHVSTC